MADEGAPSDLAVFDRIFRLMANISGQDNFNLLVKLELKKEEEEERIRKLQVLMDLHTRTATSQPSQLGITRKGTSSEVGKDDTDLNTLRIALQEHREEVGNLRRNISRVEQRLLGFTDVLTVSSRFELDLLRSLRSRLVYQGNTVKCLPFASQRKMKHLADGCVEFKLELISPNAVVEQVITAVVDASISAAIASTTSHGAKSGNTDIASTSGTSKDEDDDENKDG